MEALWLVLGVLVGAAGAWFALVRTGSVGRRAATPTGATPHAADPGSVAPLSDLERMRQALDALNLGVVISDAEGAVVVRNRRATSGSTGALHTDVLVGEAVDSMLERARAGEAGERILELYGPPARVVVVTASPLVDGGAVVTVEDVTERSRLDAIRTDFVANVSHELKTPVGAVAILAEALVEETDPEVVRRFATKMVGEAHRMGSTIDNLLELSRIELGGEMLRQRVEVPRLIAEAVERVEAEADRRRIGISVDCDPSMALEGDSRQLVSALGNLVENAVKYSDDGGTVTVCSHLTDTELEISVADSGVGIPSRDLDRVFERFYRVDRARSRGTGGTGLGLSIVRHVATNHGGRVTVTSREGEGSTFTLSLPRIPTGGVS